MGREFLLHGCFVPIHDSTDKGRDEESTGFGGGNGLHEGEHECEVAVDTILGLEDMRRLDAFPG